MAKQLKIKQIKSLIGSLPKHKRTMQAIGFHRNQQTLIKADSAQLRGMLQQVRHLVVVQDAEAAAKPAKPKAASAKAAPKPKAAPKAKAAARSATKAAPKSKAADGSTKAAEAKPKGEKTTAAEEQE